MFRALHVFLVSYALLACPYRCLGSSPTKCASAEQARTCSCCDVGSDSAATEDGENAPAPSEPCKCNCLCQGAVLSKDDVLLAAGWDLAGLFESVLPPNLVAVSEGLSAPAGDRSRESAPPSGRLLRFALQSLQI